MKKIKIFAVIGLVLLAGIYYYLALPAINIHSADLWMFVIVLIIAAAAFYILKKRMTVHEIRQSKTVKSFTACLLIVVGVYLVGAFCLLRSSMRKNISIF